ncbi:DUF2255 family protein [Herbiconiux solani]|uniref:DUF2255 family protein n=1 Tax=Herbiconiux solani TaxID=661329 RepID=UPI000A04C258|nr:DUF2255 family protein [Herbiconiux solani]
MAEWAEAELDEIANTEELRISSPKQDGSMGRPVPIWVVRLGQRLYVRSADGPHSGWFARANAALSSTVTAGSVEREVTLEHPTVSEEEISEAYRKKYAISGAAWIANLMTPLASSTTRALIPLSAKPRMGGVSSRLSRATERQTHDDDHRLRLASGGFATHGDQRGLS